MCDESLTRPRVGVRRAKVTIKVSMKTTISADAINDPDALAQVQEEINNAGLQPGLTVRVINYFNVKLNLNIVSMETNC